MPKVGGMSQIVPPVRDRSGGGAPVRRGLVQWRSSRTARAARKQPPLPPRPRRRRRAPHRKRPTPRRPRRSHLHAGARRADQGRQQSPRRRCVLSGQRQALRRKSRTGLRRRVHRQHVVEPGRHDRQHGQQTCERADDLEHADVRALGGRDSRRQHAQAAQAKAAAKRRRRARAPARKRRRASRPARRSSKRR